MTIIILRHESHWEVTGAAGTVICLANDVATAMKAAMAEQRVHGLPIEIIDSRDTPGAKAQTPIVH